MSYLHAYIYSYLHAYIHTYICAYLWLYIYIGIGAGTNYLRIVDLAFEAPDMSWGENDNISSTRKRTHKKTRSSSSLSATSGVSSKSLNTGAGVIDREHDGSNRENNQGFADWKKAGYEDEIAYCNTGTPSYMYIYILA